MLRYFSKFIMFISKPVLSNLFFLFTGQGIGTLLLFIATARMAKILGPEGFSVVGFAEAIFAFFVCLTNFGLNIIGTREVARKPQEVRYYGDRIITLKLILGILSYFALFLFVLCLNKPHLIKYVILLYGLSLLPASIMPDWLFQGLDKMHYLSIGLVARTLIFMLGIFSLINKEGQLLQIAYIFFVSWMISSAITVFFYARSYGLPKCKFDFLKQGELFKKAVPIGYSLIVGWIIYYFDSLFLFLTKGEVVASIFMAAQKPILLIASAITLYFNAIFPAMSRAAHNLNESRRIFSLTVGGITAFFLPIVIASTMFSETFLSHVYGKQFLSSTLLFQILIWWPWLTLLIGAYSRTIVCFNMEKYIFRISTLTAILHISFNLFMIPRWGGLGACIAKISADIVALFYCHRILSTALKIPFFEVLSIPLISGLGMLLFVYFGHIDERHFALLGGLGTYIIIFATSIKLFPSWLSLMQRPCVRVFDKIKTQDVAVAMEDVYKSTTL
ncbi:MAG: oligosaccharide flippase family protein [Candidatus Omnitrophota bacterium]